MESDQPMSQARRLMCNTSFFVQSAPGRQAQVVAAGIALFLGLNSTLGCGGEDRLEVAPVHGRIVYKGKGVPRATVIFFPEGETANVLGRMRPFAYSDDEGNFNIKTYVEGDGAPPGEYRISVIAPFVSRVKQARSKDGRGGPEDAQSAVALPMALSEKYANVETSGLKVTIQEGENKLEPFSL
jgi:hypothetical protein